LEIKMVKSLYSHKIETKRNKLAERIYNLMSEEVKQGICLKREKCSYVEDTLGLINMNPVEAKSYVAFACEKYPNVCEVNL